MSTCKDRFKQFIFLMTCGFLVVSVLTGCVVKEELNNTYNQAHLGLNQWSLLSESSGSYRLDFDAGYLIGLVDEEGVAEISWNYELMTTDQELIALNLEEMREASPEKTQIFVEGSRQRSLELNTLLREGETYILWFTLYYREEILHEQLFGVVAGEEGGDPNWLEELLGDRIGDDVTPSDLNTVESSDEPDASDSETVEAEPNQEIGPTELDPVDPPPSPQAD